MASVSEFHIVGRTNPGPKCRLVSLLFALAVPMVTSSAALSARDVNPSPVIQQDHLRSSAAATALAAAEAEAQRLNVGVSISILDEGGNLLREARMDGASVLLIEYARRKAQTALLYGASTSALAADSGITRMIGQVPNLLLVPGGVPVRYNGKTIGAIGVSGAAPDVDARIAEASLLALTPPEKN
jgi:glc operon protein GlcG